MPLTHHRLVWPWANEGRREGDNDTLSTRSNKEELLFGYCSLQLETLCVSQVTNLCSRPSVVVCDVPLHVVRAVVARRVAFADSDSRLLNLSHWAKSWHNTVNLYNLGANAR